MIINAVMSIQTQEDKKVTWTKLRAHYTAPAPFQFPDLLRRCYLGVVMVETVAQQLHGPTPQWRHDNGEGHAGRKVPVKFLPPVIGVSKLHPAG